jgi:guanylate kinase
MKFLTTLTGPTCAGKTTLERMLVERGAQRVVSTTTRMPRASETNGVDYYFVSDAAFHTIGTDPKRGFVECAKFGEHWYGAEVRELERLFGLGDHVVYVCEPMGALNIHNYCKDRKDIHLTKVFVDNPFDVVAGRFLTRFWDDMRRAQYCSEHFDAKPLINRYAKRLTMMQSVEQGWRTSRDFYDLYLPTFDEYNATAVAITLSAPQLAVKDRAA